MSSHSPSSISARRQAFKALHASGCFVIPNPWDVGSARYLQGLGFKALATTSSGYAWSRGRPDGGASRDEVLAHLRDMAAATDLPVNADFESGYAPDAQGVHESVRLAVETGVAGISIEDASGDAAQPIRPLEDSLARLKAARSAIDEAGGEVLLVGRAENFLYGIDDLAGTIERLKAYADAGADCVYAPMLPDLAAVRRICGAVRVPVNVLAAGPMLGLSRADLAAAGAARISLGSGLARVGHAAVLAAARAALEGDFRPLAGGASGAEVDALLAKGAGRR